MRSYDGKSGFVGLGSIWLNSVTLHDLSLMTCHYEAPYHHPTSNLDLDSVPAHAEWLFVGAREAGSHSVALGAFGRREEVLAVTPQNQPHRHNDVWWYRTSSYSFGFSPTQDVSQYRADALQPRDERRLSWHLQGDGGWRAGGVCDLNGQTAWRKVVLYGVEPDRFTAKEVGAVDVYMGEAFGELPPLRPKTAPSDPITVSQEAVTARRRAIADRFTHNLTFGQRARLFVQQVASLTGTAVTVEAFKNALASRAESPKYGLLKTVSAALESGPQLYLAALVIALEGYAAVREAQPVLVASAAVSLVALASSLTGLLTSEVTSRGLRLRDGMRSQQVALLVGAYFAADAVLRARGRRARLRPRHLPEAGPRLHPVVPRRRGAPPRRAPRRLPRDVRLIVRPSRLVEVTVRAVLPLIADMVLQARTPAQRRWGFVLSTALCAGAVLFGVGEYAPRRPEDAHLRIEIVALLCAAVTSKYLAFVACVFPAMSDDSYGVVGVLQRTRSGAAPQARARRGGHRTAGDGTRAALGSDRHRGARVRRGGRGDALHLCGPDHGPLRPPERRHLL